MKWPGHEILPWRMYSGNWSPQRAMVAEILVFVRATVWMISEPPCRLSGVMIGGQLLLSFLSTFKTYKGKLHHL